MRDDELLLKNEAEVYFRSLTGAQYLQALVDKFPRILNKLFELKDDKPKLRDYFESLVKDSRCDRKGFQFDQLMCLQNLRELMLGDVNGFVHDDSSKWVS